MEDSDARAMVRVLGAPLTSYSKIDVEPLCLTDFCSDDTRWMLRAHGSLRREEGGAD